MKKLITIFLLLGLNVGCSAKHINVSDIEIVKEKTFEGRFEVKKLTTSFETVPYIPQVYNDVIYFVESNGAGTPPTLYKQNVQEEKVEKIDITSDNPHMQVMNYLEIDETTSLYFEIELEENPYYQPWDKCYQYNLILNKNSKKEIIDNGFNPEESYFPRFQSDNQGRIHITTESYEPKNDKEGTITIKSFVIQENKVIQWFEKNSSYTLNERRRIDKNPDAWYLVVDFYENENRKGLTLANYDMSKCIDAYYENDNYKKVYEQNVGINDKYLMLGVAPMKDFYMAYVYNKYNEKFTTSTGAVELFLIDKNGNEKKVGHVSSSGDQVYLEDWYMGYTYSGWTFEAFMYEQNKFYIYNFDIVGGICAKLDSRSVICGGGEQLYIISKK